MNNKRRCQYDNGESLVSQMNQLSIKQVNLSLLINFITFIILIENQ
jgi:hypothetical protein